MRVSQSLYLCKKKLSLSKGGLPWDTPSYLQPKPTKGLLTSLSVSPSLSFYLCLSLSPSTPLYHSPWSLRHSDRWPVSLPPSSALSGKGKSWVRRTFPTCHHNHLGFTRILFGDLHTRGDVCVWHIQFTITHNFTLVGHQKKWISLSILPQKSYSFISLLVCVCQRNCNFGFCRTLSLSHRLAFTLHCPYFSLSFRQTDTVIFSFSRCSRPWEHLVLLWVSPFFPVSEVGYHWTQSAPVPCCSS